MIKLVGINNLYEDNKNIIYRVGDNYFAITKGKNINVLPNYLEHFSNILLDKLEETGQEIEEREYNSITTLLKDITTELYDTILDTLNQSIPNDVNINTKKYRVRIEDVSINDSGDELIIVYSIQGEDYRKLLNVFCRFSIYEINEEKIF